MSNIRPFCAEVSVGIKNLDARVFPIAHVDQAFRIGDDRVRKTKFPFPRAPSSPLPNEVAVAIELHNPRIAFPIGNINFSRFAECYVVGTVEVRVVVPWIVLAAPKPLECGLRDSVSARSELRYQSPRDCPKRRP